MKTLNTFAALILTLLTTSAFAQEESLHYLSVGEGIASPAVTTPLLGQNPAGMIFSDRSHFHVFGSQISGVSGNQDFDLQRAGAFLHFGSGKMAGTLGAEKRSYSGAIENDPDTEIYLGLAFKIDSIDAAFGLGGKLFQRLDSNNEYEGSNDLDVGMLFGVESDFKVGLTVFNVLNNQSSDDNISYLNYGVGLGWAANDQTQLVVDGRFVTQTNDATDTTTTLSYITPGVKVAMDPFQLSISYRLYQDDEDDASLLGFDTDAELMAGFGVAITSDVLLQLQYHRLGEYDMGLTFRF